MIISADERGKGIWPISTSISDKNIQPSSIGTPCFIACHRCCYFSSQIEDKTYTRQKITTRFVVVLAFSRWSETDLQFFQGVPVEQKFLNMIKGTSVKPRAHGHLWWQTERSFPNFRSKTRTSAFTTSVQHCTTSLASEGQKYKEIRGTQAGKSESCHLHIMWLIM